MLGALVSAALHRRLQGRLPCGWSLEAGGYLVAGDWRLEAGVWSLEDTLWLEAAWCPVAGGCRVRAALWLEAVG